MLFRLLTLMSIARAGSLHSNKLRLAVNELN